MAQSPDTRARQHLLLQGFTLYTSEAADALRAVGSATLDDPQHAYAVELPEKHVLCCLLGERLLLPLDPTLCRDARMRIEAAVMLGKAPPAEKLSAFSDEAIEHEARRRAKQAESNTPAGGIRSESTPNGTNS